MSIVILIMMITMIIIITIIMIIMIIMIIVIVVVFLWIVSRLCVSCYDSWKRCATSISLVSPIMKTMISLGL
jgi:hypothetical protein